jgi:tetratricopeptide (TPR) repeat protein
MDALRDRIAPLPVYDYTFTEESANPVTYLQGLPAAAQHGRAIVFLYDLNRGGERVWGYLEMQRETLANQPHGLVFWMTPAERGEAVQKAPNFWSQRSGVFDFTIHDDGTLRDLRDRAAGQEVRFRDQADWARQVRLYRGLLEEYEQSEAPPEDTRLDLYDKLAELNYDMGHYEKARHFAERQLELAKQRGGRTEVGGGLNNLGLVLRAQGDLEGAKDAFERALRIDEAVHGPDHPNVAAHVNNLGSVLRAQGDLEGARAAYERALRIDEAVYGPDHPNVAIRVNNLGSVLHDQGDLEGARAAYERALRILKGSQLPPDHPHIAVVRRNLESLEVEG